MPQDTRHDPVPLGDPRHLPALAEAGYTQLDEGVDDGSARRWWDASAAEYLAEHGEALGASGFVWGPEGLAEADARLLGELAELRASRVLEIGAGAAQCARWLATQGIPVVASDISGSMLAAALELNRSTGVSVPLVLADGRALPFADSVFDVVFTSYGVVPFVSDVRAVHREVARVLRPGGRWAFSTTHPIRWAFPDDPGAGGLTARRSYFDTRPYVERAEDGHVIYAEHHRTLAQHVQALVAEGFVVDAVTEPEWVAGRSTWGGWSELRARHLPGTLVLSGRLDRVGGESPPSGAVCRS